MKSKNLPLKRYFSTISVIVILLVAVTFCISLVSLDSLLQFIPLAQNESKGVKQLLLKDDQIEFTYPENWVAQLTPQGNHGDKEVIGVVSVPAKFFLNIIVARKESAGEDASSVADWGLLRAQSRFIHYELISLSDYLSESFSGLISEYIARTGSPLETQNVHCKDLYFTHNQNGYAFSFCTTENDWTEVSSIFDEIISSIRFLE